MGLSITTTRMKSTKYEGVSIRVYEGLLARLFNRPVARGYVVKLPAMSMPYQPGMGFWYNIFAGGQCHGGPVPTLNEGISIAISHVHE